MPIHSMTGFARAEGTSNDTSWVWEVRAVNSKGLDVRLRLPPGLDHIEVPARQKVAAQVTRGNLQISLNSRGKAGKPRLVINREALAQVSEALKQIGETLDVGAPTADGILAIRGVLEADIPDPDETERNELASQLMTALDRLLADLNSVREREGAVLAGHLGSRLDELDKLIAGAEQSPARTPEAIRKRLTEQVALLLETNDGLDAARLHQEAVLLATKADIREELDRLGAHVAAARELLAAGGPVGRKLDFFAQELNREVNTVCAKSNDLDLTAIGLEMKSVVDQLREQIQNLE